MNLTSHSTAREILAALRRQGWTVMIANHVKARPPDKTKPMVVTSSTPGDTARGIKNWLSALRRSGFVWPEDA